MVKRDTQKREHLHRIGFFRVAVFSHWMNAGESTIGFAVKAH